MKILLAFGAIYVIWGTTYLAIKIGLEEMPPFVMASLRYLIAGSLLIWWWHYLLCFSVVIGEQHIFVFDSITYKTTLSPFATLTPGLRHKAP